MRRRPFLPALFTDARRRSSGQILPLFALFIIVLFGMAALAIDVSRAYADLRFYRATADAASLAGAQDLQVVNSRTVTAVEQEKARTDALNSLVQRLGGDASSCGLPKDNIGPCMLTGTPYEVTIKTPSPSCSSCDPVRSVQVTLRHPAYGLTFARVLGSNEWDLGTTSVAGLEFGKAYAIITLRPQKKLGSTFDIKDITLDASVVRVEQGDVGSNSNMNYSGSGSILILDPDYNMYYVPGSPPQLPQWGLNPVGKPLSSLIKDPNYRYPLMTGSLGTAPTYDDARASKYTTLPAVERADTDAACAAEALKVDPARYTFMATQALNTIYCYEPGVYLSGSGAKNATITIGTGDVGLLKSGASGAYYLKSGLDVSGRIIGGYEPGSPGVALMFDEAGPGNCSSCIFSGNNALTIALNAGTRFPPDYAGGSPATAALDWDNQLVETSGPASPTPPLVITLLVQKDPDCYVPTTPPLWEPATCNAGKNKTINIAGGGSLALEGVQYAPTDNVEIHGGSSGDGRVGQIISWTLFYSGGTHINQEGPANVGNGTLRIDAACSAPSEPCNP